VENEFIYRDNEHLRRNLSEQANRNVAGLLHFGDLMKLAKDGMTEPGPASSSASSPSASISSKLAAPIP
jgi:hypothetical protein